MRKHQSHVKQAVSPVAVAVSATPIEANTDDDFDHPQVLYGNQPAAAPAGSSSSDRPPTLIDGYLLITQKRQPAEGVDDVAGTQ